MKTVRAKQAHAYFTYFVLRDLLEKNTKRLTSRKCLFRIDVSVAAAVVASVKRPHNSVMADSDFITCHDGDGIL